MEIYTQNMDLIRASLSLMAACLDDFISADNSVRVIEAIVDVLNLEG
jgi:transposase